MMIITIVWIGVLALIEFCEIAFICIVTGLFIAISSITYAAISAYLSLDTAKDKQGAVQGTLMGARSVSASFKMEFDIVLKNSIIDGADEVEYLWKNDAFCRNVLSFCKESTGL